MSFLKISRMQQENLNSHRFTTQQPCFILCGKGAEPCVLNANGVEKGRKESMRSRRKNVVYA